MTAHRLTGALALTLWALAASGAARADHQPVLVIPGRADVPVIIDGVDAGGAVVTGEWGLYRPGHGSRAIYPNADEFVPVPHHGYFPSSGQRPRYGRYEVDHRKSRRGGSTNYYRAWSAQSEHLPATIGERRQPLEVTVAPELGRGLRDDHHRRR